MTLTTASIPARTGGHRWHMGMMSGTSLDAIDVALLLTDGETILKHGPAHSFEIPAAFRKRLSSCLGRPHAPAELEREVTDAHARAATTFLREHARGRDVASVGFHGQTILHRPESGLSIQIGDPSVLARTLGIPVVGRLRQNDMAHGGQGAPIAPIYHREMLRRGPLPAVQVNIGGVANVTWTDGDSLVAFDCGPGNARIDDLMQRLGHRMDTGGMLALAGVPDEAVVARAMADPFFRRRPPKSLDRDDLSFPEVLEMAPADAAATLAAITADAIAASAAWLPTRPERWVVGGGGRHNGAIMRRLRERLGPRVAASEGSDQDGDAVEAYMIAYLAARHHAGLPITFPSTTGVEAPCPGGVTFLQHPQAAARRA